MRIEQVALSKLTLWAALIVSLFFLIAANALAGSSLRLDGSLAESGNVSGFSISPDGDNVSYTAYEHTLGGCGVFVTPIAGGSQALVSGSIYGAGADFYTPLFSPSGQRVLFQLFTSGCCGGDLYSAAITGNDTVKLTSSTQGGNALSGIEPLFFVEDGQESIVCAASNQTPNDPCKQELFRASVNGGTYTKINAPLELEQEITTYSDSYSPRLSPTGDRIVYSAKGGDLPYPLMSITPSGEDPVQLNTGVTYGNYIFSYTPNGEKLLFGGTGELYSVDTLGGTPVMLNQPATGYGSRINDLAVLPNGLDVVYIADEDVRKHYSVYKVSVAGGNRTKLADLPELSYRTDGLVPSADGNWLIASVVHHFDGVVGEAIMALPTSGGSFKNLSQQLEGNDYISRFKISNSEKGTHAVYLAAEAGLSSRPIIGLFSANVDSGDVVRLDLPELSVYNPSSTSSSTMESFLLTADEQFVVFASGDRCLFAVPVEGGEVVRISEPKLEGYVNDFKISPDGSKVVFMAQNGNSPTQLYASGFPLAAIADGLSVSGEVAGGVGFGGGIGFEFDNVTTDGILKGDYSRINLADLPADLAESIDFMLSGETVQVWDMSFTGEFDGPATLTFTYDEALLGPGVVEDGLAIYHQLASGSWEALPVLGRDLDLNTITVTTDSFSWFAVAAVPEPSTVVLLITGLTLIGLIVQKGRNQE